MKNYIRTIISTVLCYAMALSMLPAVSLTAFAATYTGAGTEANPYVVSNQTELVDVLNNHNAEGVHIKLDSNITLTSAYVPGVFNGILDGDFYKITAVTPFFTTNKGTLKNFFYTDTVQITETTSTYDGVICNQNNGLISGVIATGDIAGECYHSSSTDDEGPSEIGIVAGYNNGTIVNCAAFGSLSADCEYGSHAGAITRGGGTVYNCYASAVVNAMGGSRYGSSSDHAISLGTTVNCYYNSDIRNAGEAGGFTAAEMKTQKFVDLLNSNSEFSTDSAWVMDTKNANGGFPVLSRALNATVTSSKTNILIQGTESVALATSDSSATIYYTLDGKDPTTSSNRYTGPISIKNDTKIKAVTYKNGLYGQIVKFSYAKVDGLGTKTQPYLIGSDADFMAMKELENTAYFRITQNIALEDEMFSINSFFGSIDGQGYTISGVYSDRRINGFVTKNYGVIQNLTFATTTGTELYTNAVFASYNYGVIYNCHYTGNINGGSMTGVQSCNIGGLVADNYGRLEKSSFTGKVYADAAARGGGVVGYNAGSILYCDFDGSVYIASACFGAYSSFQGYVGGFVGYAEANCSVKYCTANVTSVYSAVLDYTGVQVGGFVGNVSTTAIVDCTVQIGSVSYGYGYTEWGSSGTNYYTGTSSGAAIPVAHAHNFDFVIQNPICGENREGINSCACGITVVSSWYESDNPYNHDYTDSAFVMTDEPTCTESGIVQRPCTQCEYYDTLSIPATDHLGTCVYFEKSQYPESTHYANSLNETKTFAYSGASSLRLYFNSSTQTEKNNDFIILRDKDGNLIGRYTGEELSGAVVLIPGDKVEIALVTNSYNAYYGYSFDMILAYMPGNLTSEVISVPTHAEEGVEKLTCKCGHTYTQPIAKQPHTYTQIVTPPTCTEQGYTTYTCTGCGYSYVSNTVSVSKHNYVRVVTAPTCIAEGYTTYTCDACGDTYTDSTVAALGHDMGQWTVVDAATCAEEGSKRRDCSRCDHFETNVITVTGHSYNSIVIAPTCTAEGYTTHTCGNCGDSYTDTPVAALNHNYVNGTCDRCGDELSVVGIAIKTAPAKIEYMVGESLDTTGLTVTVTYTNGSAQDITEGFTVTGFDSQTAGVKTLTVTYKDQTATIVATVKNAPVAENAFQIYLESKQAKVGTTVTVEVYVKNNPGFGYLELTPLIPAGFTLVKAENGDLISDFTKGKQYLWIADENVTEDGLLMTFTFAIDESVALGNYQVDFRLQLCADFNETELQPAIVPAVIEVIDFIYGDANNDGKVSGMDIIRLKRYLADLDYETGESSVEIFPGADANGDGKVSGMDIIRLKRYLADLDYETGESTIVLGPSKTV